jgi:DTW domain-containing protein YfiP
MVFEEKAGSPMMMKFTLLTSSKEILKPSNTGKLVKEVLKEGAEQICWNRLVPPAQLLKEIEVGGVALLYPGTVTESEGDLTGINQMILIDSTWHEARKIHQRSPYLHKVRRVSLSPNRNSQYTLRKNQRESCLCTAECVIEILQSLGRIDDAEKLHQRFIEFITPNAIRQQQIRASVERLRSQD